MALRIDNGESPSESLNDMKIQVVFKHLNGVEIVKTPDPESINKDTWSADSIGDLPCVGDWIVLPDYRNKEEIQSSINGYKVVGRHIDFGPFASKGDKIHCTVLVEAGTE